MANRRMFAKSVIDTDKFIDMSVGARLLYYELGMQADDDGFLNNPKRIQRTIGVGDESLNELVQNDLLILFDSGIVAIRHWLVNNQIRADVYHETICLAEKNTLEIRNNMYYIRKQDGNGSYTEREQDCNGSYTEREQDCCSFDTEPEQDCCSSVAVSETQDRLGKERLGEVSQGKGSQGEDRKGKEREKEKDKDVPPLSPQSGDIPPAGGHTLSMSNILYDDEFERLKKNNPDRWENICNSTLRRIKEGAETCETSRAYLLTFCR